MTAYNVQQGSEAWHDLRCGRFTASKFKDLMAGDSTAGYKGLIYNTVGEILSGTVEPGYSNAIMERGSELESDARLLFEDINGVEVEEIGFATNEDVWPEYVGVSPDGMVNPQTNLEIKCPMIKTHVEYLIGERLPNAYKWQVQGQMLVTGADSCEFMSFYPGTKPFILTVEKDEEMHEQLMERIAVSVDKVKELIEQIKAK